MDDSHGWFRSCSRLPEVKAHFIKLLYHVYLMLFHFELQNCFLTQIKVNRLPQKQKHLYDMSTVTLVMTRVWNLGLQLIKTLDITVVTTELTSAAFRPCPRPPPPPLRFYYIFWTYFKSTESVHICEPDQ